MKEDAKRDLNIYDIGSKQKSMDTAYVALQNSLIEAQNNASENQFKMLERALSRIGKLEENFGIFETACVQYINEQIESSKNNLIATELSATNQDHFRISEQNFRIEKQMKDIENQFSTFATQLDQVRDKQTKQ